MKRLWVLCAAAAAAGCVHDVPAPPVSTLALAGGPLAVRDWGARGPRAICDAEPQFLLDELTLVNSGLQRFLTASRSTAPADWPEERIAEVEGETQQLPGVLEVHGRNLELLGRCAAAGSAGFPFVMQRGRELVAAVHERMAALGRVVQQARHARALDAWHGELREQKEALRGTCRERARTPQLYLAWRSEKGDTHWKFCDGSEVTAAPEGPMLFDPSYRSIARGQRRFAENDYLTAVRAWPRTRVLVPPEPPSGTQLAGQGF